MKLDHDVTVTDVRELEAESFDWGAIKWLCSRKLADRAEQTLGLVYLFPGRRNPLHYHPNCEELLHVLSGEGDHRYGDDWVKLRPGMTIRIPAGLKHQLVSTSWEPLTCIISFSSGDRQTVFLE